VIQLVIATRLQEVIDNLDADKIANATDVLAAVEKAAKNNIEIPLVKTGQGDTERMVYERDLIGEVNNKDMWVDNQIVSTLQGAFDSYHSALENALMS
jgi:hypothetical protein